MILVTNWRKSSYSAGHGACAEVGQGDGVIGVRDSTDRGGPVLVFAAGAWREFTRTLKAA